MNREEMEHCWSDRSNWFWGIYNCKRDPRFIVPKRIRWMGWTVNFGHRWGTACLVWMVLSLVAALLLLALL